MTKNKFLLIVFLMLLAIYVSILFVKVNNINLNKFWYGFAIFFIGLYALIYFNVYRLDSSLYYGVLLTFIGAAITLKFVNLQIMKILPLYLISFAFAHLSNFVVFKQNIHLKIFAILFLQIILIVSYKTKILNINLFLMLSGIFIFLLMVGLIYRFVKNLRRG